MASDFRARKFVVAAQCANNLLAAMGANFGAASRLCIRNASLALLRRETTITVRPGSPGTSINRKQNEPLHLESDGW